MNDEVMEAATRLNASLVDHDQQADWRKVRTEWTRLLSMEKSFAKEVKEARQTWLDEYGPHDGTDCVTPFDQFLY